MNGWYEEFRQREDELALMYADMGEHPDVPASAVQAKNDRLDPKSQRIFRILTSAIAPMKQVRRHGRNSGT